MLLMEKSAVSNTRHNTSVQRYDARRSPTTVKISEKVIRGKTKPENTNDS